MATVNHTFKFEKKFNVKGTADLTPSLDVKLDCAFPLDGTEVALAKKIEKNFAKQYEKLINGQLAHFEKWLKEKQQKINEAKALHKAIKKMSPKTEGDFKKLGGELNELDKLNDYVSTLENDFEVLSRNWAQNVVDQQAEIAIMMAKKQAGAKLLKDKKTRMVLGKVIRGVLVVSAIAVGVVALVASAGTAAPLVLGLGIAAASLSGIGGLVGFAKTVARDNDLEQKVIKNVESDLKQISSALDPLSSSSIGKHVLELETIVKQRNSELATLKMELKKTIVMLDSQIKAGRDLAANKSAQELFNNKEFQRRATEFDNLRKEAAGIGKKIEKASAVAARGERLCRELGEFGVKIDEFSKYYKSSSVGGNLKSYFSSVDGYVDLAKSLGAFRPGASLAG